MAQTNPKNLLKLEIDTLSYGPYGIGRVEGKAVMVPHTAPGDAVEARILEDKGRHALGELLRVIDPSPLRRIPPCPYVGACGGCSWQHLSYSAQLEAKQKSVADALRRIGKFDNFELRPIIPADKEYHYRRRIRLQTGPDRRLGFYGASSHHLVEIDSCSIADDRVNAVVESLRRWIGGLHTSIAHLSVVTGDEPGQIVAAAEAAGAFIARDENCCTALIADGGGVQGLVFCGRHWRRVWGEPRISVRLTADLSLTLEGDLFTQVNPEANRRMISALLGAGDFQASDRVLELYSGAGNFTLPVARRCKEVVAVESHRAAVANGTLNAQKNDLANIRWLVAPVPKALGDLKRRRERFDKIILDPPRTGAKGIAGDLAALDAAAILYVSCNPATLARDLADFAQQGYKLRNVQPMDFFPQTYHVEALALMER